MEEPDTSDNLKLFLKYTFGTQWHFKLIHLAREVLIFQLRVCLKGCTLLTPFNRRQWLLLFSAWTVAGRQEQLELLANSGGFLVLYDPRAVSLAVRCFLAPGGFLYCPVPVSVVRFRGCTKNLVKSKF